MIHVAVLGFGVVGSGVAEVLTRNSGPIGARAGEEISLKYILDVRDFPDSPYKDKFVKDFSVIEADPEVGVVVETIGGATAALEFTRRALTAGKSVVSSNKELVAEHGRELLALAREHRVSYLFEASVGGGIPILHPLTQCLAANRLREVRGILNGTTNYILTHMIGDGVSFSEALKAAQDLGYAERDPSADVEGTDACRKICILAAIAFGRHVYPGQVATEGITGIAREDVELAEHFGMSIKLLGRAIHREDGKIVIYVAPHLIPTGDPLAGVEDVFNAITVRGNAIGDVMFYGRGAGKLPTASAVVSDVIETVRGGGCRPAVWDEGGADYVLDAAEALESRWMLRLKGSEGDVGPFGGHGYALRSGPEGQVGLLTGPMTRRALEGRLAGREALSIIRVLDAEPDLA